MRSSNDHAGWVAAKCLRYGMATLARHDGVFARLNRHDVVKSEAAHGRQMLPEFTADNAPTSVLASDYCVPALPISFAELPMVETGFPDILERIAWGYSQLQARKIHAMRNEAIRQRYTSFGPLREWIEEVIGNDHGIQ